MALFEFHYNAIQWNILITTVHSPVYKNNQISISNS